MLCSAVVSLIASRVLRTASLHMGGASFSIIDDMNGDEANALIESYQQRIETIRAK
jgi:hypothetical protein